MRRTKMTVEGAPLAAIDLFCGAGGLSEGLRTAGFRIVAAADSDPDRTVFGKLAW